MGFVLGLSLVVQTVSAQQGLHVLAQFRLLLQQVLARAHQVTVLFQFRLWYADKSKQAIGVELRQLRRINAICLDLFAAGAGNTGRRNNITMIAFFSQIPLQGIADIRRFIT